MDHHLRLLRLEHPFPRQLVSWRIEKDRLHLSRMPLNRVPQDRHLPFHRSRILSRHLTNRPRLPPRRSSGVSKAQHRQLRQHIITEAIASSLSLLTIPHNGHKVVDPMLPKDHRISEQKIILSPPCHPYQCEEHLPGPVD